MTVTELWLVRHGESIANVAATRAEREGLDVIPIDIRDADVPLSDVGREQAAALADWMAREGRDIDGFYVSPAISTSGMRHLPATGSDHRPVQMVAVLP